jgi:hypothetical protein
MTRLPIVDFKTMDKCSVIWALNVCDRKEAMFSTDIPMEEQPLCRIIPGETSPGP